MNKIRWQKMRELNPWYSNFCAGIVLLIIFGGYSIASIYFGWIHHLAWNHTITNAPGEGIILAGRVALFAYLFTFFGAFMAVYEFWEMLNRTKEKSPDYIQKVGRVNRIAEPVNDYDPQEILRRRGALYIIHGHRFYTEASVLAAMKEANELSEDKLKQFTIDFECWLHKQEPFMKMEMWGVSEKERFKKDTRTWFDIYLEETKTKKG